MSIYASAYSMTVALAMTVSGQSFLLPPVPPLPPTNLPPITVKPPPFVALSWSPSVSPDVVGYNVYEGTASGVYTNEISTGNVTNWVFSGLARGFTYYFAAAAVNSHGIQSALSSEASFALTGHVDQVWLVVGQSSDLRHWTNICAIQDPLTNGMGFLRVGWQVRRVSLP